jgi:hypothetical protein
VGIPMECAVCGGRFEAKRATRKYCSPRCRVRASRAGEPLPPARDAPPVVKLAPAPSLDVSTGTGLLTVTVHALEEADRVDTPMGQATLLIARLLDSGIQDTGSSIAALIRQYDLILTKALDGADKKMTPLEKIRREREMKAG